MLNRRRFLEYSALSSATFACPRLFRSAFGQLPGTRPLRLAVLGSEYRLGSHLQDIADRFLVGYPHNGDWYKPDVQVVSVYVDQRARISDARPSSYDLSMTSSAGSFPFPKEQAEQRAARNAKGGAPLQRQQREEEPALAGDLSAARAKQFGFRLSRNIPDALRCGGDRIAVDAVLTIVEQDSQLPYPANDRRQILLPSYDFFQQCVQVFEEEKHAVPYFNHKELSFSFAEALRMVGAAERLRFPLLAGSSMPVTWRLPDVDIPLGAHVEEAVMVGFGGFDAMAFDALEAMQSMVERRKGGETGVKSVQLLEGDDVWKAAEAGRWWHELLRSALSRSDTPLGLTVLDGRTQDLAAPGVLQQVVPNPIACSIEYSDGTKGTLLMLDGAIQDFNVSVRITGQEMVSTQFFMPPKPNRANAACLTAKIEQMSQTRTAPYSAKRTLLTSGILEAAVNSRHRLNERLETPHLAVSYQPATESQYART